MPHITCLRGDEALIGDHSFINVLGNLQGDAAGEMMRCSTAPSISGGQCDALNPNHHRSSKDFRGFKLKRLQQAAGQVVRAVAWTGALVGWSFVSVLLTH